MDRSAATPRTQQQQQQQQQPHKLGGVVGLVGSLRVIEIQLVIFVLAFTTTGLIMFSDFYFPTFFTMYSILLSKLVFPPSRARGRITQVEIFRGGRWFRIYMISGTVVGLFFSLAYILGGYARGDEHAIRSAAPQLFLLAIQIIVENVVSGWFLFSPPVRALIPVGFSVRRTFLIVDWVNDLWVIKTLPKNPQFTDIVWHYYGRVLALSNLVFIAVNLFGFLVPCFLARGFYKYFEEKDEETQEVNNNAQRAME